MSDHNFHLYTLIIIYIFIIISFTLIFFNNTNIALAKSSEIIYVGGTGLGNYSSIQEAINKSNESDEIIVYDGNYSENLIINKSISLIGFDKNNVTIYGNNGGCNIRDIIIIDRD